MTGPLTGDATQQVGWLVDGVIAVMLYLSMKYLKDAADKLEEHGKRLNNHKARLATFDGRIDDTD